MRLTALRGHRPRRSAPRRIGRFKTSEYLTFGVCVVAVVATLYVLLRPPPATTAVPASGTVTFTRWGPLDDNDRLLLTKVRQAGLWEMPTGQQAQQRAGSEKVKEAGQRLAAEHGVLDADVRSVAAQLGVVLPSTPNPQQQGWMQELSGKTGDDYDRTFVNRLRAAHGKVFAIIGQIRANTRNGLIRAFAERAQATVLRHMNYLESTGLVDYSTLN